MTPEGGVFEHDDGESDRVFARKADRWPCSTLRPKPSPMSIELMSSSGSMYAGVVRTESGAPITATYTLLPHTHAIMARRGQRSTTKRRRYAAKYAHRKHVAKIPCELSP